jgi:hypothetical protein
VAIRDQVARPTRNATIAVPAREALLTQLRRHEEQIKTLQTELQALTAESMAVTEEDADQPDRHAYFVASGPTPPTGAGFLTATGMSKGVIGIGSADRRAGVQDTIGVWGYTTDVDYNPVNGTGVKGTALGSGGLAVHGHGSGGATGVQGTAAHNGWGVVGSSETGVGIFGFGGRIGVEGTGDEVGVLGGPPEGTAFSLTEGPGVGIGVVGTAIGDVRTGDVSFSYGGWFDGLNGTAPIHIEPSKASAPTTAAKRGDLFVDGSGRLWFCTDTGDPATWKQVQLA